MEHVQNGLSVDRGEVESNVVDRDVVVQDESVALDAETPCAPEPVHGEVSGPQKVCDAGVVDGVAEGHVQVGQTRRHVGQ